MLWLVARVRVRTRLRVNVRIIFSGLRTAVTVIG